MSMNTKRSLAAVEESGQESRRSTASFFEDPLRLQTIVVPLDFSTASLRALEFALPLAKRFGARVEVVHVYEGAHQFSSVATSPVLWSEEEAKRYLADEVELTFGTRPRREDCHLRVGKPEQEIVAVAEELKADLIVIATHGRGGLKHLMLGNTTEKVIRQATCPVLVVREATRGPIQTAVEGIVLQKILVPVDFSDCAKEGARYASVFATGVGANLLLLHIVRPPDYMVMEGTTADPNWPQLLETSLLEAEDKLDQMVNFLPLLGISAETQVEVGVPVDKLIEASAWPDIDLVITSTHGYSGLRHALLGSVAEQIARQANCPVLVVPSHPRSGKGQAAEG
jgi:nucleotide-binding universal stress UspA family protein